MKGRRNFSAFFRFENSVWVQVTTNEILSLYLARKQFREGEFYNCIFYDSSGNTHVLIEGHPSIK